MKLTPKKPRVLGRGLPGQQPYGVSNIAARNHSKPQRAARLPSPAEFYAAEIPKFKDAKDDWAWGRCPFHDDRNPSFSMNLYSGSYKCMSSSCGAEGKSLVAFVCARDGLTTQGAIRYLEDWS